MIKMLIPQRIVTGYRMVIYFRKLNKATRKYHYPMPFIGQMLEGLPKNTHTFASLMDTLVSLKYLYQDPIKRKPLLLVLLELMLIDVCLLVMQCTCYLSKMHDYYILGLM